MAQYRKRPVIVEAEQWFPGQAVPGVYGCEGQETCQCHRVGGNHDRPHVLTAHNQIVNVEPGDWIIAEPGGRGYYPCKPDIFERTYEPA